MPTKIILLNGPPRSGKDTAASKIIPVFSFVDKKIVGGGVSFDRFSMPCKAAFAGTVGAPIDEFGHVPGYEETKDEVIPWLGCSYRQWQIDYSESFMKPKYGKNIFSRLFVHRNENSTSRAIVVPDSGFAEEAEPVAKAFGVENTLLIRVHRPGTDFSNDSRSHIYNISPNELDIYNDSDVESFHAKIIIEVAKFLERK